ncbi:MAG: putative mitomycin resistance protein [Candidatus Taylorbacteria bacterium]|nr:putative mitomycin resistance protein [Candidatus Taylorbacteria bacterium]
MKSTTWKTVKKFEDIPNIGPAMVKDFKLLGLNDPMDLKGKDPYQLYLKICKITKSRHDQCVLDTYMAAVDFMNGASPKFWWKYTLLRKEKYPDLSN